MYSQSVSGFFFIGKCTQLYIFNFKVRTVLNAGDVEFLECISVGLLLSCVILRKWRLCDEPNSSKES
jgi:hypothetical protein